MSMTTPALQIPGEEAPPVHEPTYAMAARILRSGAQGGSNWGPVVFMTAMLAISMGGNSTPFSSILVVAGTLLLRDLGHWAGVHLLEYPDKEQLLLPFFRKHLPASGDLAESWKRGLITLLGPLPPLLLAFIAAVATRKMHLPALNDALLTLAVLNGFWLLPFGSLDGSRLLNIVLFSRSRVLELLSLLATSLTFVYLGLFYFKTGYFYILFGVLGIVRLPQRWRIRRAAGAVAARFPDMPRRPELLEEAPMRMLFEEVHPFVSLQARRSAERGESTHAGVYAGMMRAVHAEAVLVPPSLPMSILLLSLYVGGIILAALTVFVVPYFKI